MVRLHARHRVLGEPFVLGAVLAVLGIDILAWGAVEVFRPAQTIDCRRHLTFCYVDPVPNLVTYQWTMAVLAAVILVTLVGCVVLRHGILVTFAIQTVLTIVLVVQVLPNWSTAAQQQNLLRTCHYGANGTCSGIVNLVG